MADDNAYSLQRIADRLAIQDTMYRWCRAVDRLDLDGMRAVFHPDAIDNHGAYNGGVDGLIDWIRNRHRDIPFSMHAISNILIEFAGPDTALVETYIRTTQRYPAEARQALAQLSGGQGGAEGSAMDLFTCSRYIDRFERRNGEWRILRRAVVADWKQVVAVPADAPQPQPGWETGRRDADDLIYRERRALGLG
ncbi:MAG: nuclear transport factor 2 family protein [Burkholderiales bacterium]